MTTIYRDNTDRLSVADAKRLILDAVPLEKAVEVYAQVDDQGNINWDGNVECLINEKANIPASHLDHDFLATCNDLSIRPRMKYRPVITDYAGNVSQDGYYTITHDEFVRLAELFGLLVRVETTPEPQDATPAPVADSASNDATPDPERRLALLRALGGSATYKRGEWRFRGIVALEASEKREGRPRSSQKTIREDLIEAAQNEFEAKRAGFASGLGQR